MRRYMVHGAERLGVLVMVSGVVGNNTHRRLSVEEFGGFALTDEWAPLVFVNDIHYKEAQLFTLAHELAHIWLGQSAVSDSPVWHASGNAVETWCNAVAAEVLVPSEIMRGEYNANTSVQDEIDRLARLFGVDNQVILRRMYDAGGIDRVTFQKAYDEEVCRAAERKKKKKEELKKSGGDRYDNVLVRSSHRFARTILSSTLEGKTQPVVSRRLLDVWKQSTIKKLSKKLGVVR